MFSLFAEQEEWKAWSIPVVWIQRQDHQDVGHKYWHVPYDTSEYHTACFHV